jgi:hypothetical protein
MCIVGRAARGSHSSDNVMTTTNARAIFAAARGHPRGRADAAAATFAAADHRFERRAARGRLNVPTDMYAHFRVARPRVRFRAAQLLRRRRSIKLAAW